MGKDSIKKSDSKSYGVQRVFRAESADVYGQDSLINSNFVYTIVCRCL